MGLNILYNKGVELTKGESTILNKLKQIYENVSYQVYIYVQATIGSKRPDFIIMDEKKGVSIIEVKDWSEDYIVDVDKIKVKLVERECENPIRQIKGYRSILLSGLFSRDFDPIDEEDISMRIVLTNIKKECQDNKKLGLLFSSQIGYLFKNDLSNLTVSQLFDKDELEEPLLVTDLNKIRASLFPEIEIISLDEMSTNQEIKVLDFDQEEFAKRIPLGHYMVTGVPGSGKTVILLSRAVYLVKEHPNWRILILTYNKSLSHKLNSQLERIAQNFKADAINDINIENIEIRTFHSQVNQVLGGMKRPINIDKNNWFKEESVNLAISKAHPIYDAILIDEYQDFYMNWISFCLQLCKEYTVEKKDEKLKNIFLAGDRLQSIYNPHDISWKSIGINMRGRSKFLKTSYRSTKQHLNLALNFLKNDKNLKKEVDNFYIEESSNHDLEAVNNGSVEFLTGSFTMIGDRIIQLKNQGYQNEDFLILCPGETYCNIVKQKSSDSIKYEMEYIKDLTDMTKNIILTTYHSSKGLEAKVVFLMGIDKIYVGNDVNDAIKRKLIYVGMTRASEKLYIHSQSGESGKYLSELKKLSSNEIDI